MSKSLVGEVRGTLNSWNQMRARCNLPTTPGYENYGGRGISYDPSWEDFKQFKADLGYRPKGHTLERLNNNANYSKDNCKWATMKEQAANRRNSV